MKRFIFAILAIASLVFARDRADLTVVSVGSDGRSAVLKGDNVQKGATGIVITKLNDTKNTIVASVVALSSGNEVNARFEVLTELAQDALPRAILFPKVGDKAVFYSFDERSTIIAKNQSDYQKIVSSENRMWLHPDLFAALLTQERIGEPKQKDFAEYCKKYSVGTIHFAIKDKVYVTDCQSFEILDIKNFASENAKEFESPFYKRTGDIETGYLGMFKENVKDYESYYLRLLGF
ncbi:MAG: plasminogen-binding N-terminal domain-containing protein [Campylobacterales bacterium]|nr:plasminogen-binding N-terminal domain-containing protein [Campylobacterales bacterium]